MINLRRTQEMLRQMNQERREYFEGARDENARLNLRMLKKTSIFLIPFILFLFCLTSWLFAGWEISLSYILLLPVLLCFAVYSVLYSKRPEINVYVANISCVLFVIVIEFMVILIDVYQVRSRAYFMPFILVMVPSIFVLRSRILIPLMTGMEIIYVIAVLIYKIPIVAAGDIFSSVVGVFFGGLMASTVVQLRIKDNNAKREYLRLSMVDSVTGLLNKYAFEKSVREAVQTRETDVMSALLVMDLDNLKRLNDEFGTMVGDMFLEDVADFLTHLFRGWDIIGRVGGDEFMVYIRNMKDEDRLSQKCFRLQQEVKSLSNEHGNINLTMSIGAAVVKDKKVIFDEMYEIADNSLYTAKTRGRGKYVIKHMDVEEDEN